MIYSCAETSLLLIHHISIFVPTTYRYRAGLHSARHVLAELEQQTPPNRQTLFKRNQVTHTHTHTLTRHIDEGVHLNTDLTLGPVKQLIKFSVLQCVVSSLNKWPGLYGASCGSQICE